MTSTRTRFGVQERFEKDRDHEGNVSGFYIYRAYGPGKIGSWTDDERAAQLELLGMYRDADLTDEEHESAQGLYETLYDL